MNNTNSDRRPTRPSPLPTWNAIHDPPSDDEDTNLNRNNNRNRIINRIRGLGSDDDDDDDVDMLDRASVAPPPRQSATSRSVLGSGSGQASRRPNLASSLTMQGVNANSNTNTNTDTNTATTNANPSMSASSSRPSSSLGLLKRKDKEHASEQSRFSKRAKLSTLGGGASGSGLGVGVASTSASTSGVGSGSAAGSKSSNALPLPTPTRISRPLTVQTARKSAWNAYGPSVLGGAGTSGSALESNSTSTSGLTPTTAPAREVGADVDVGSASVFKPRPRTKQTARKSTSSPAPKVDLRAMLPPAVPRPLSRTSGGSSSVPAMTAGRPPGTSTIAITTPTPTTARHTDDEMDVAPSSSSSPGKTQVRPRPRPVAKSTGSVASFSGAGVRARTDSTSISAAGSTAAVGSRLASASTLASASNSTSISAPVSTKPKPKPKPATEVIEISSDSEDDDDAPSASAPVNLKSKPRPKPKPTFLSMGKPTSSSTNAKPSSSNANAKPSSSSNAKPSSNPTNPSTTTKPTTATTTTNLNSRSSSPVSVSSIVSARTGRRTAIARKSTGGGRGMNRGAGGAGLSASVGGSVGAGPSSSMPNRGVGGAGAGGSVSAGLGVRKEDVRRDSPMSIIELSSDDDDDDGAAGAEAKAKAKEREKPTNSKTNTSASANAALARRKEEEKQRLLGRIAKLHEEIDAKQRAEEEMMRGREVVLVDDVVDVDEESVDGDKDKDRAIEGGGGDEMEAGGDIVETLTAAAPVVESAEADVQMRVEEDEEAMAVAAVAVDKGKGKDKANENENENEWNRDDDVEMNTWIDEDLLLAGILLDTGDDDMIVDDGGADETPTVTGVIPETPQAAPASALHAPIAPLDDLESGIIPSSSPSTAPEPSAPVIPSTPSPKPTPFVSAVAAVVSPAPTGPTPVFLSPPKFPNRTTATNAKPGSSRRPSNILAQIAVKSTGRPGMSRMVPSSVSPPSGRGDEEGSGSSGSGSGSGSGSDSDSDDEGSEVEERAEDSEVEGGKGAAVGTTDIEGGVDGETEMGEHDTLMQVDAAKNVTPPPSKMSIGVKQQVLSPVALKESSSKNPKSTHPEPRSKKRQQTLAEAITMTGKANIQKQRQREKLGKQRELLTKTLRNVGNKPDVPIDLTSDVEDEDGPQEMAVDDDMEKGWEKGVNKGEMGDGDPGPPPTTASSVGSFGGWSAEGAGGSTQIPSTSAVPMRSQVNEQLLSSSRNLVNNLKQKAAAKKQMRYTPSTPSSGHPSLSPPTLSPDQPNNSTTSIDANIQSMIDAGAEGTSDPSTPVPLSSPPIPAPSPSIPNLGPSPVQITPLTQAVVDMGLISEDDAASRMPTAASTNSFSDIIPPSLSRVWDSEGGGSSPSPISQPHSKSPNRAGSIGTSSAKRTPVVSPAQSKLSSPQRVQVPNSPRPQVASPQQVASLRTSPHRSPLYPAGPAQSLTSHQSPQSDSGQRPPMHQTSPQRSPVHVTTPQRSPAQITSPRRSSFGSPSHKQFGHKRNPSAPNSSQMFASTSKTGSSPLGGGGGPISSSKPASPSSRSWFVSGTLPSSSSNKTGDEERPRPDQDMASKPLLPTRIPARPTGIMSMSAVPTMTSVQSGAKFPGSLSEIARRRAGSVDAVGLPLNADGTGGVIGAAATKYVAPITKIVEPRTEPIVEQPLGVPAVAAPEVGMINIGEDDDDDFYVDDGAAGVPQLPPASDDEDEAMAEIQELVSTSHSDDEMMDVDYDNPLPHPPVSEIPSSVGTPSSLDSSGPGHPNSFQRRITRRSSSNQSDELFDRASSPESSRRTTPEEGGIAAATTSTQQHQQPFGPVAKSYGGFPLIFWPEERRNMRTYSKLAEPKYARDLPHKLQDHINAMSAHTQLFQGMRGIFEATIQENTAEGEPDAPPIKIINDVDDEPTPPWEFYYTNTMWHGEGVPAPDIENLQGCDCEGVCGSKSKTCSCLARQRAVTFEKDLDWVYDKNGRLNKKTMGYPIYECNERCGCGEECRNRVVQHGRKVEVNIQKTLEKGWGIFAGEKKIPRGTFIGIYSGEIITNSEAHVRGIKYNKFGRTYLFDIDFYHLKTSKNWKSDLTVDAYHAGNFTRFLNHSCDPNCRLYACYTNEGNIKKPLLAIFAIRDIEPKEEICFSYSGDYPGEEEEEEEEEEEIPGPSQESNNRDDDGDDENDNENDRIWEECRCGAANCRGGIFVRR